MKGPNSSLWIACVFFIIVNALQIMFVLLGQPVPKLVSGLFNVSLVVFLVRTFSQYWKRKN